MPWGTHEYQIGFFLSSLRNTDMWTTSCLKTTPSLTAFWTSGGRRAVRGWDTCTAGTLSTKTSLWASGLRWLPSTNPCRWDILTKYHLSLLVAHLLDILRMSPFIQQWLKVLVPPCENIFCMLVIYPVISVTLLRLCPNLRYNQHSSLLCYRMPPRTAWNCWMIPKLQLWMKLLPNWACARLALFSLLAALFVTVSPVGFRLGFSILLSQSVLAVWISVVSMQIYVSLPRCFAVSLWIYCSATWICLHV